MSATTILLKNTNMNNNSFDFTNHHFKYMENCEHLKKPSFSVDGLQMPERFKAMITTKPNTTLNSPTRLPPREATAASATVASATIASSTTPPPPPPTTTKTSLTNYQLIKSNSYCGAVESSTVAWQAKPLCHADSMILAIKTSSDMEYGSTNNRPLSQDPHDSECQQNDSRINLDAESTEYDAFLLNTGGANVTDGGGSINTIGTASIGGIGGLGARRNSRSYAGKMRASCCLRTHAFITRNWYWSYLVPISILGALIIVAYLTRDYAKLLLFWIETQNPWVIFIIFMCLFTVVSFPIVVGYFVLLITAGYLFGSIKGWFTVILGANLGIAIAHWTIRSLRHHIPIQRLIKNETGRAILRVISGPRAFKVVLFTRLTPIPFGLQNAIFGISSVNLRDYHLATFLGLLPAQTINVYLGSTLRSMHEVLNNEDTKLTGYISFLFEVICGIVLMCWVVQKARKELSATLLTDITNEGKLGDVQV